MVCCQEVFTYWHLRLLVRRMRSFRQVSYRPGPAGPAGGLVTFSRRPVSGTAFRRFGRPPRAPGVPRASRFQARLKGALVTRLGRPGLCLINTHPVANYDGDWSEANRYYPLHRAQFAVLARVVNEAGPRAVVCGDFNIARESLLFGEFMAATGLADAFGVCLELLDDKMQAGYAQDAENDTQAAVVTWLDAWSDVLRLCDATGISSIGEFDDRFPLSQSLFNWSQDLEMALENAGRDDGEIRRALIDFCEESFRRFPREDQLLTENRRRTMAQAYFDAGMTEKAEELFRSWLDADPAWGWGWIGWADCYLPGAGRPADLERAEKLLRRGDRVPGVRDRVYIAERLQEVCEDGGRPDEAGQFGEQAERLRQKPLLPAARPLTSLGNPLPPPGNPVPSPGNVARTVKVGRNEPCPCGSGKKYKKCCGSPLLR